MLPLWHRSCGEAVQRQQFGDRFRGGGVERDQSQLED